MTILEQRLDSRDRTIAELIAFKTQALSRLAAQHDEIVQLRVALAARANIRRLPTRNISP